MNTIGKILVILNLLFALLTGGFLAIDFAARSSWKDEAEHRKRVADVARASAESMRTSWVNAVSEKKKLQEMLDNKMLSSGAVKADVELQLANLQKELELQKERTKLEILNAQKALGEAQRRHEEVKALGEVIKQREQEITQMQLEVTKSRNAALEADNRARTATLRATQLLEQLKQKEIALAEALRGPAMKTVTVRDAHYENPPPAYVKGKISKIDDRDRTLVQINIGSDVGIQKDNTLEVYRLRPAPEYLGRLRVVDVHHHLAIGQLLRSRGGPPPALREGDEVASTIR
jgi:hypothetical protein